MANDWRDWQPAPGQIREQGLRASAGVRRSQSKYGVRTDAQGKRERTYDGVLFASKHEMRRYQLLLLRGELGEIADLELQPTFPIVINGIKVGKFTADFRYCDLRTGELVTEDSKSKPTRTEAYSLRKRVVEALHGISISEV